MGNKKSVSVNISEELAMADTADSKAFHHFVAEELKGLYWCGQQQAKWYGRLQKAVSHSPFVKVLEEQAMAANLHTEKIEQVFELLGEKAKGKKSLPFETVMEEVSGVMAEMKKRSPLRDTLILLILQKAVLFQLAAYDVVIQASGKTGNEEIIHLLEENRIGCSAAVEHFVSMAEELKSTNEAPTVRVNQTADSPEVEAVYDSINLTGKTTPR